MNQGEIHADIDFIQSEEHIAIPEWMDKWETATTGAYREFQGFGQHADMFKNKECAVRNAQLIKEIVHHKNRETVL